MLHPQLAGACTLVRVSLRRVSVTPLARHLQVGAGPKREGAVQPEEFRLLLLSRF